MSDVSDISFCINRPPERSIGRCCEGNSAEHGRGGFLGIEIVTDVGLILTASRVNWRVEVTVEEITKLGDELGVGRSSARHGFGLLAPGMVGDDSLMGVPSVDRSIGPNDTLGPWRLRRALALSGTGSGSTVAWCIAVSRPISTAANASIGFAGPTVESNGSVRPPPTRKPGSGNGVRPPAAPLRPPDRGPTRPPAVIPCRRQEIRPAASS